MTADVNIFPIVKRTLSEGLLRRGPPLPFREKELSVYLSAYFLSAKVCMYVYIYIYIHIYTYGYVHAQIHACMHAYIFTRGNEDLRLQTIPASYAPPAS